MASDDTSSEMQDPLLIKVEPLSIIERDVEEQDPLQVKRERYPVPILPRLPPTATALIIPVIGSMIAPNPLALDTIAATTSRWDRKPRLMSADQKRRCDIKNGFDTLQSIIPHLKENSKVKLSNGAVLKKGGEYIQQLKSERDDLYEEIEYLRQEIEDLNTSISNFQSLLPDTEASMSEIKSRRMQELFDEHVKKRSRDDWKYKIFSFLFKPLLDSFDSFMSNSSFDDLHKFTILWIEQHCRLVNLRPVVLDSLKHLSTKTDILTKPENFEEEIKRVVLTNKLHYKHA